MKSNRFWLAAIVLLLVLSAVAAYMVMGSRDDRVAVITQNGLQLWDDIGLDQVKEPYTIDVGGKYTNQIEVEPGRIRVAQADCPDQICVGMGWISGGGAPIVCLPNGLVIEIEGGQDDIDGVAQ